jgi:hypothetical protein
MNLRRFFGNVLIVLGALNILDFASPRPIPTVGPSAFIVGGVLIGFGFFLRAERDASGKIQWGRLKTLLNANAGTAKKKTEDGQARDPMLAVRTLRLASERGGKLTVAQAAMELDVPIDSAEAALDECTSKGSAFIDVDRETGIASYHFPEFEKPSER